MVADPTKNEKFEILGTEKLFIVNYFPFEGTEITLVYDLIYRLWSLFISISNLFDVFNVGMHENAGNPNEFHWYSVRLKLLVY